jgi:hypothetical protein
MKKIECVQRVMDTHRKPFHKLLKSHRNPFRLPIRRHNEHIALGRPQGFQRSCFLQKDLHCFIPMLINFKRRWWGRSRALPSLFDLRFLGNWLGSGRRGHCLRWVVHLEIHIRIILGSLSGSTSSRIRPCRRCGWIARPPRAIVIWRYGCARRSSRWR